MQTKNKNIGLDIVAGLTQEQARHLLTCIHAEDADFFRELTRKVYPKTFDEASLAAGAAPSWAEFLLRHRISGTCIYTMVDDDGQIVGGDDASDLQVINPAGWDYTSLKSSPVTVDSTEDQVPDTDLDHVEIFTDGACSGNPGPGGWAAVFRSSGREWELYGGEPSTTNNRMELMAAISALETLQSGRTVTVTTDSKYVKDGITKWVAGWKRNGWKTAARKDVKNRDLWERLVAAADQHVVVWKWVRGHDGHPENERADLLARQVITVNSEDWASLQDLE